MVDADKVFAAMIEKGCSPDIVTYGALMNGYILKKNIGMWECSDCSATFYEILGSGELVDEQNYVNVLYSLCNHRHLNEAIGFSRSMENMGHKFSVFGYSSLIDGAMEAGMLDIAMELFPPMLCTGVQPDVETVNIILKGLFNTGNVSKAFEFLDDMRRLGISSSKRMYATIMEGFLKYDKGDKAVQFLNELIDGGELSSSVLRQIRLHS